MSICVLCPPQPRQLVFQNPSAVWKRLRQVAPVAYPILEPLLADKATVILTGSVVAAAAGSADSNWHPSEWQESDLDVFCTGKSTTTAVHLIRELLPHAESCLWAHRGRVVELSVGGTRIQIIHTGGSLPDSHLSEPMEVLDTFDMTHLQVGLCRGNLLWTKGWSTSIETGISEIISPDVLGSRVEKNLQRGYQLRFPVDIRARGLQGYDGSHWRVPAPLGTDLVEHLTGIECYEQCPTVAGETLLSVWGKKSQVRYCPVMHPWTVADLETPVTAWAWLAAHQLPRASARLWWDLVLAACPHPELYRLRGTRTLNQKGAVDLSLSELQVNYVPWDPTVSDLQVVELPPRPVLSTITGYHGETLLCVTLSDGRTGYYPIEGAKEGGHRFRDADLYSDGGMYVLEAADQRMSLDTALYIQDYLADLQ